MTAAAASRLAEQAERILGRPAARRDNCQEAAAAAEEPIFQVGRWPVIASFWYSATASSLIPAKKLYESLYSRTWSRQNCQYSLARSRPFGARWVAGALHFGHWQAGNSSRSLRSWSGLTRMRSNSGEFVLIVIDYACAAMTPARLDSV